MLGKRKKFQKGIFQFSSLADKIKPRKLKCDCIFSIPFIVYGHGASFGGSCRLLINSLPFFVEWMHNFGMCFHSVVKIKETKRGKERCVSEVRGWLTVKFIFYVWLNRIICAYLLRVFKLLNYKGFMWIYSNLFLKQTQRSLQSL